MRLMSTMYSGETSRNFIIGMRLWPPDSNFASGPSLFNRAIASSSVVGEKYPKLRGIIGRNLSYIGFYFAFKLSVSTGKAQIIRGTRGNVNMDHKVVKLGSGQYHLAVAGGCASLLGPSVSRHLATHPPATARWY